MEHRSIYGIIFFAKAAIDLVSLKFNLSGSFD
jgi:hypothetical protein